MTSSGSPEEPEQDSPQRQPETADAGERVRPVSRRGAPPSGFQWQSDTDDPFGPEEPEGRPAPSSRRKFVFLAGLAALVVLGGLLALVFNRRPVFPFDGGETPTVSIRPVTSGSFRIEKVPGVRMDQLRVTALRDGDIAYGSATQLLEDLPAEGLGEMELSPGVYSLMIVYGDTPLEAMTAEVSSGQETEIQLPLEELAGIECARGIAAEDRRAGSGKAYFQSAVHLHKGHVSARLWLALDAALRRSAPDLRRHIAALSSTPAAQPVLPRLRALLTKVEQGGPPAAGTQRLIASASSTGTRDPDQLFENRLRQAETALPAAGVPLAGDEAGLRAAQVTFSLDPRTENRHVSPGTGDIILLGEPSDVPIYFYVSGGSVLKSTTRASVKKLSPPEVEVLAWAPSISGQSRTKVAVRPNTITTVRFRFPNPRRKLSAP